MKQKLLLFLIACSFSWQGFSQANANTAPNLTQCNNELFNLTVQDNIILGNQPQPQFEVHYFTSFANAQSFSDPITSPQMFGAFTSPMSIFARVDNTADGTFDTSFFTLTVNFAFAANVPDVTKCGSHTLPNLTQGEYFTAPGGGGTQLFPGHVITETTTIYVYDSAGGNCSDEESFVITITPSPDPGPIYDMYSCEPYVLPVLPNNGIYYIDGVEVPAGTTISETTSIGLSFSNGNCGFNTGFQVVIDQLNLGSNSVFDTCNSDGDGFGIFNLQEYAYSINYGNPNIGVTFYETETDAQFTTNEIQDLSNYVNTVANQQTVYIRVQYGENPQCSQYVPMILMVFTCSQNTISGNVRFDYDNNGCTAGDTAAANIAVTSNNGNDVAFAYTDANGNYTFTNISQGNHVISVPGNFGVATPQSYTVNVTGANDVYEGNNFCITPSDIINDVKVQLFPNSNARPGFALTYTILVTNVGSVTANGTITMVFDDGKLEMYGANPVFASQTANTVTFNYTDLLPFEANHFYVYFNVFTPPTVNAGEMLTFSATANLLADADLANNDVTYVQTVVNSYDPNDIMVLEGAYITEAQADGFLNYIVRFQNTGTGSAVNVRINNGLDANLDWSTFTPLGGSHLYQAQRNGDEVTFQFNNIDLPSMTDNESGSHGFIAYSVKPVADFEEGEIISNTADIFFDFNAPIVTNTVTTQVQTLGLPGSGVADFVVYPNPASRNILIQGAQSDLEVLIFDLQGKLILNRKPGTSGGAAPVDISGLQKGMYLVRMTSDGQTAVKKLVVR